MKVDQIREVSIYHHDKMSKAKFAMIKAFVDNYLELQIELYDLFDSVNSFINYKNKKRDNVFEADKNGA